jgi:hypothetical protein
MTDEGTVGAPTCFLSFFFLSFRKDKYELTQIQGQPSFYNVEMKLRILNVSESDFGHWKCIAKNSHGETSGEIMLYGKVIQTKALYRHFTEV